MKGAIGNAFILNMVITFIIIFYVLLIGSMAYSKAYKTKNYIINLIDEFETTGKKNFGMYDRVIQSQQDEWNERVNEYLGKIGYVIADDTCPVLLNQYNYEYWINHTEGGYDYCVYRRIPDRNENMEKRYNYLVQVYMKFDFPVIGKYVKIPLRGETKTYTQMK